jgi:hypothetical protein
MEVAQVVALLTDAKASEAAHCRDDLERGARLDSFPALIATSELRGIYRRRAEHLDAQGSDATGAFETAEALEATSHAELALAKVSGGSSGLVFQLFLTPRLDEVVACVVSTGSTTAG